MECVGMNAGNQMTRNSSGVVLNWEKSICGNYEPTVRMLPKARAGLADRAASIIEGGEEVPRMSEYGYAGNSEINRLEREVRQLTTQLTQARATLKTYGQHTEKDEPILSEQDYQRASNPNAMVEIIEGMRQKGYEVGMGTLALGGWWVEFTNKKYGYAEDISLYRAVCRAAAEAEKE